jgi:hypothetical protein
MSEVVRDVQREFWRPPAPRPQAVFLAAAVPALAEICTGCNAEFVAGSRFCYLCGAARIAGTEPSTKPMEGTPAGFLRALSFQNVKHSFGLPLPSMIAFLLGLGCILAAMLVGVIYTVEPTPDFQAVQLWRMEWLLGAVVAFVAAILFLLKTDGPTGK